MESQDKYAADLDQMDKMYLAMKAASNGQRKFRTEMMIHKRDIYKIVRSGKDPNPKERKELAELQWGHEMMRCDKKFCERKQEIDIGRCQHESELNCVEMQRMLLALNLRRTFP